MLIKILHIYIQSIIIYLIKAKVKQKDLYIVGATLFKKHEFRLSENDRKSVLLILKLLKRILIRLHFSSPKRHINSNILIFDGSKKSIKLRSDYVKYFSKETDFDSLGLEDCIYSYNKIDLGIQFLIVSVISILLFPLSLISKLRIHVALLPTYFLESYGFLRYCKKNKIQKVHYFCIYEGNANINAFLLKKYKIYCNKIPSEVPLYFSNTHILTDELSTCFAYQEEELKFYKHTVSLKKISNWGPEHIVEVLGINNKVVDKYQLGFYSSGMWLRSLKGNHKANSVEGKAETEILKTLIEFVSKEKLKPVLVFLHPSEKNSPEQFKLTKAYYEKHFNINFIEFADINIPSNKQFDLVDLSVSFISTILYERLYLGHKTIIATLESFSDFPLCDSPLNKIRVRNTLELNKLIKKSLKMTDKVFFEEFQLSHYVSKSNEIIL